ncbi:MAG: serine/threonine-protein kinase [Vicinamibacterales bacterium]
MVGPYSVTGSLGEGAMGAVYRAHDSRLKRDVAIKVLPPAWNTDAERRARFTREAQMLAALNHPNIAQIHGVEEADGYPALVMELVEGPTLADRLRGGPLLAGEAIAIALQLCDGIDAAHERRIVHRDLKPANIKVRPDGSVKILDFGLARALVDVPVAGSASEDTQLLNRTEVGLIVGTPAYMSPEQARGQAIDKRSDIWAFGCILYETLTGRPPFGGATTTDILSAIVHSDPDWTRLPEAAPVGVRHVLQRCLQKNLRNRQRDIGDVRMDLSRIDVTVAPAPPVVAEGVAPGRRRSWRARVK